MMRHRIIFVILTLLLIGLLVADILYGTVSIPFREVIDTFFGASGDATVYTIVDIRLTKAIVAVMAGAALTVSGLQMQTLFRNPLAGPYVLGLSSGASLGVALFILGAPYFALSSTASAIGIAGAAWIGAGAVMVIIAAASKRIKDIMVILILGIMLSSAVSAVVQILQYLSDEQSLKSYVIWTMGSLGDVTGTELTVMTITMTIGMIAGLVAVKPLNVLTFGEDYARSMGIDISRSRQLLFLSTSLLAGAVTAFCGPIGFIGIAVPHVARTLFSTANHRILFPAAILLGADTMLVCDLISKPLSLPVNSITALLGIPIVIWIVLRNKTMNI